MIKRLLLFFVLLFSFFIQMVAQIKGVVKDADTGEPLPYLNVFYEGKAVGAITDLDGKFEIQRVVEWKELTFSSIGYVTQVVPISNRTQELTVLMKALDHTLDEVVVKPRKGKYSRKNNPAVELMKKVVAHKEIDDLKQKDYYSYNTYQKLTFAVNNITADSLRESKIFQKFPFFKDQVEYCKEIDKHILPVSVDETVTQNVYRKHPESEKSIVRGINSTGVNELFNTGDILTTVLKDVFQNVNVYEDRVRLLQYPFDSPISDNGIGFYRYYHGYLVCGTGQVFPPDFRAEQFAGLRVYRASLHHGRLYFPSQGMCLELAEKDGRELCGEHADYPIVRSIANG